jgi:hypothetical protein
MILVRGMAGLAEIWRYKVVTIGPGMKPLVAH